MRRNVAILLAATTMALPTRAGATGPSADAPVVDVVRARTFSDDLVKAILAEDLPGVRGSMEPAFREAYDTSGVRALLDQMFAVYGKPLEAEFKSDEVGKQVYQEFETARLSSFSTEDGGASWKPHGFSWFGYDPWTALREKGPALVIWLGGTDPASMSRPIRVFRSRDSGASWASEVETIAGEFDGAKLAVEGEDVLLAASHFSHGDAGMRSRVAVHRVGDRVEPPVLLDNGPPTRLAAPPVWVDGERAVVAAMSAPTGADGPEAWAHLSEDGGRSFASKVLITRKLAPGLGTPS